MDVARLRFALDPITSDVVQDLIAAHLQLMQSQSPAEAVHALAVEGLRAPEVRFWSAWIGDQLVGCAALKRIAANEGEIKSMHVRADSRRLGIAKRILAHLEADARTLGLVRLSLETGSQDAFAPARNFYATHGYAPCPRFADYPESPYSAYMTKAL